MKIRKPTRSPSSSPGPAGPAVGGRDDRRRGARGRRAVPRRRRAARSVIKAQVLVGGRGQGRRRRSSPDRPDEAERGRERRSSAWTIKGITVRKVLVGAGRGHRQGVLPRRPCLDRAARRILLMGSAEGGVEIEQVADERPEAIVRDPRRPDARAAATRQRAQMAFALGLGGSPQGRGRDRQGPRPDDARLRRRPRRDQPARDRPRGAAPTAPPSSGSSASTRRSPSTTPRSPATRGSRTLRDPDEEDPADREAREAGLTLHQARRARSAAWSTAPGSR